MYCVNLQVTGGALEQLGSNVSITASVETLRVDIIESEASKLNKKKRKTGLHPGNTPATSGDNSEVPGRLINRLMLVKTSPACKIICNCLQLSATMSLPPHTHIPLWYVIAYNWTTMGWSGYLSFLYFHSILAHCRQPSLAT